LCLLLEGRELLVRTCPKALLDDVKVYDQTRLGDGDCVDGSRVERLWHVSIMPASARKGCHRGADQPRSISDLLPVLWGREGSGQPRPIRSTPRSQQQRPRSQHRQVQQRPATTGSIVMSAAAVRKGSARPIGDSRRRYLQRDQVGHPV